MISKLRLRSLSSLPRRMRMIMMIFKVIKAKIRIMHKSNLLFVAALA